MIKAPIIIEGVRIERGDWRDGKVEQFENIYLYSPWTQTMQLLKWIINTDETLPKIPQQMSVLVAQLVERRPG